jgi:hypothetical protein
MVTYLLRKVRRTVKIVDFTGHIFFVPTVFETIPDFRSRDKKHICKLALVNFRTNFNKNPFSLHNCMLKTGYFAV